MTNPTLAGTTVEARAGLLRFGSAPVWDCSARHGDNWRDPGCGKPAKWYVGVEDAHAGITANGYFNPATTYTNLCAEHLAEVRAEPRRVFSVERRMGRADQFGVTVIDVSEFERMVGDL